MRHVERLYQEYKTPDAIALRIIGARKPFHHDKVAIPGKAVYAYAKVENDLSDFIRFL